MAEKILSIASPCEGKYKEKSSVFIAKIFKVESRKEAEKLLDEIRKEYFDATHHCFAYKIFNETEKYSDDGEPNGTAGIRILNALNHFSLTNVLAVVIRYFGGVKLGVGPLGKAYYSSIFQVLSNCKFVELQEFFLIKIETDFNYLNVIYRILGKNNSRKIKTAYSNNTVITAFIKKYETEKLKSDLIDQTKNNVKFEIMQKIYLLETE